MVPARPALTEAEYWRGYDIIRNDVNAAMVGCYAHRTIVELVSGNRPLWERLNRNGEFWRINAFSLQGMMFIVLARIFDPNPGLHSIYKVLYATTACPGVFSKASLRARKVSITSAPWPAGLLDDFVQAAWEPTIQDLRKLRKALSPHKEKFDRIYKPIRDQIAHHIFTDEAVVEDLYSKTQKTDIDEILCFLHSMIRAIWEIGYNGREPNLAGDNYGFAGRVAEIRKNTERFITQLP